MTEVRSVLDKALRLQSEARRLEHGRKDIQQATRIAERVQKLRAALGDLRGRADLAHTLQQRTGITIDLSDLDNGRKELKRKAGDGLPHDNSFNVAERRIKETTERLSAKIAEEWRRWAETELVRLPTNRIAMLDRARQDEVRSTLKSLKSYAQSARLAALDVNMFVTQLQGLEEELSRTRDVPEALLTLLERIESTVSTLGSITDKEIALLRQYALDQEIELRRRSS